MKTDENDLTIPTVAFREYENPYWSYTSYFNGEALPKWSAFWPPKFLFDRLDREKNEDDEVGVLDIYRIHYKLDHIGVIRTAPPALFIFALQRVLLLLLENPDQAKGELRDWSETATEEVVFTNLVTGALRMRELTLRDRIAAWISGYDRDGLRLIEAIKSFKGHIPARFLMPHQREKARWVKNLLQRQVRALHGLAQKSNADRQLRAQLHQLQLPDEDFYELVF